jgi:uncharacterized protein with PQ loop repeat
MGPPLRCSMTQVLAVSASLLAATFLIPQIVRLVRTGDTSGVSLTWAVFGVITNLSWVWYLTSERLWTAALAPALAVGTYAILALSLASRGAILRWGWCLVYSTVLLAGALAGNAVLGSLLVVTPAVQLIPELTTVYLHRRPRGVAEATWWLCAAEAACWGTYGHLVGDGALVGYGIVTSVGSLLIVARTRSTRGAAQGRDASPTVPQWYFPLGA